jgi:hypothetical protein
MLPVSTRVSQGQIHRFEFGEAHSRVALAIFTSTTNAQFNTIRIGPAEILKLSIDLVAMGLQPVVVQGDIVGRSALAKNGEKPTHYELRDLQIAHKLILHLVDNEIITVEDQFKVAPSVEELTACGEIAANRNPFISEAQKVLLQNKIRSDYNIIKNHFSHSEIGRSWLVCIASAVKAGKDVSELGEQLKAVCGSGDDKSQEFYNAFYQIALIYLGINSQYVDFLLEEGHVPDQSLIQNEIKIQF